MNHEVLCWQGSYGQSEHPVVWFTEAHIPEAGDSERNVMYAADAKYFFLYEDLAVELAKVLTSYAARNYTVRWFASQEEAKAYRETLKAAAQ